MRKEINYIKWATIYKALANVNRLKILSILQKNGEMSVTELSKEIRISLKNTSWNLKILLDLDLVEYVGKKDFVFYKLNPKLPVFIKDTLDISVL